MKLHCVQHFLSLKFSFLGGLIATHPLFFFIIPIMVSTILASGILTMKVNNDFNWLFTPRNALAAKNKMLVERLFPVNSTSFVDNVRMTEFANFTIVEIVAKDEGTILRENIFEEVLKLSNALKNMTVEVSGTTFTYESLCGNYNGRCFENDLREIYLNIKDIRKGKYKIRYPFEIDNMGKFKESIFLGGVEMDKNDYVKDVQAIRLMYIFDFSDVTKSAAIEKWEKKCFDYLNTVTFDHIDVSFLNEMTINKGLGQFTKEFLPLTYIIFLTVTVFSVASCMTNNWIRSKPLLGLSACISACLASASSFGLGFYFGIPYQHFSLVLLFSVLAVEIDDAFIFIAGWRSTDCNLSVKERMKKTFSETAVSITISSLTTISSCCVGIVAPLPVVSMICIMGALCSFFAYIYQITFFGACMALSGYREERNMHPITFRVIKGRRNFDSKLESYKNDKGDFIMLQFQEKIGKLLNVPAIKITIILLFLSNLGIALWSMTYLKYGSDITDLHINKSPVDKFLGVNRKYFSTYAYPLHVVINQTYNYADEAVQNLIDTTLSNFESLPNVADSSARVSWLKYFKIFADHPVAKNFLLSGYNLSEEQDFIDALRNVFLNFQGCQQFNSDILFNENYTEIIATRFLLPIIDITSVEKEVAAVRDVYLVTSKSPITVHPFGLNFFSFEQALIVKTVTIEIISTATVLCFLIFFIFDNNIWSAFCVAITVMCVLCEVVGYLSLWNVKLDFITFLILVICVGFSINFPTHVSFAFRMAKGKTSKEKVEKCIYETGYPILQGAVSTILSLLILLFQPHYITTSAYKELFLIFLLSSVHSIFVIPVFMSLLRCGGKPEKAANTDLAGFYELTGK